MICDGQTDGRTDRRTDRRTGKNNMSPDPVGGDIRPELKKMFVCPLPTQHFNLG